MTLGDGTVFGIASSEQRSNLQSSEQVSGVGPIPIHPPDRSTRLRPVDQCFRDVLTRNKREDKSNFAQAGLDERGSEEQMLRDWLLSDTESKPPDGLREVLRDLILKHRDSTCLQAESDTIVPSAGLPGRTVAWTSQPPEDWRRLPIGKRPRIGHQLLEESLQSLKAGSTDKGGKQQVLEVDLDWAGAPLRIGALNVGFRGLIIRL